MKKPNKKREEKVKQAIQLLYGIEKLEDHESFGPYIQKQCGKNGSYRMTGAEAKKMFGKDTDRKASIMAAKFRMTLNKIGRAKSTAYVFALNERDEWGFN